MKHICSKSSLHAGVLLDSGGLRRDKGVHEAIILLISRFARKASTGQIAASAFLTVPAALGYLGIDLFQKISFLPLLSVAEWLGRS